MNEISNWSTVFFSSFQAFGQKLLGAASAVLGSLLILMLGWLFAKFVGKGVTRLLKAIKFDVLSERLKASDLLEKANIQRSPSELVGTFIYWIVLLLVIISASEALGWSAVSQEVSKLLGLLPNLLVAIVIFVVGYHIASFLRDFIQSAASSMNIGTGKIIGGMVFYLLLIIVSLTALSQAGVDTSIITSNLLIILATVLASAAISYGFASKDLLSNILAGFFSRRTFLPGQTIEIDGVRGKIVAIDNISITIQSGEKERVVIPSHQLITNKVKIIG